MHHRPGLRPRRQEGAVHEHFLRGLSPETCRYSASSLLIRAGSSRPRQELVGVIRKPSRSRTLMLPAEPTEKPRPNSAGPCARSPRAAALRSCHSRMPSGRSRARRNCRISAPGAGPGPGAERAGPGTPGRSPARCAAPSHRGASTTAPRSRRRRPPAGVTPRATSAAAMLRQRLLDQRPGRLPPQPRLQGRHLLRRRRRRQSSIGSRFYDWKYESEPEPYMNGRRVYHARGKVLGGSSQHQRDDLPARQPAGLRALGRRPGHGDVGLRPLPALLQADGELPRRRRRVPRRRRSARARARARDEPAVRRVLRGRRSRPATRSPTTSTATARRASPSSTATSTAAGG